MPVLNAMPYLRVSIESILRQTYTDFELVVVDNGSSDGSLEFLHQLKHREERVTVVEFSEPLGLAGSSKAAVERASAPLIARMDADDVAYPERLARQMQILDTEPDVVVVGCLSEGIDSEGRLIRPRDRAVLLSDRAATPFPHGSAIFRRSAYEEAGGYRDQSNGWEDLDFFMRMSRVGRVVCLPDVLYQSRFHRSSTTVKINTSEGAEASSRRLMSTGAFRAGLDYTQFLSGDIDKVARRRGAFMAYVLASGTAVWAGDRPSAIGVVRPPGLPPRGARARTLVHGLMGSLSPLAVRRVLSWWVRLRDLAGTVMLPKGPVEWRFRSSS
jgi:glycosyltransferase involved in cell wall biosynthesis